MPSLSTGMFLSNIGKSDDADHKVEVSDKKEKDKSLEFKTKQWNFPKETESQLTSGYSGSGYNCIS